MLMFIDSFLAKFEWNFDFRNSSKCLFSCLYAEPPLAPVSCNKLQIQLNINLIILVFHFLGAEVQQTLQKL